MWWTPTPHDRRIQVGDAAGDDTSLHSLLPGCWGPSFLMLHKWQAGELLAGSSASGYQGPWNSNPWAPPGQPVTSGKGSNSLSPRYLHLQMQILLLMEFDELIS